MARPFVIGVDCDGVLADYFKGFAEYVAGYYGLSKSLPPVSAYDFSSDPAWTEAIPDYTTFQRLHNQAVRAGLFASLEPIEGASKALWELSDAGLYVRIITHRLHNKGDYGWAVQQTAEWLDKHDMPYRSISFERYKAQVGADIYIDDSPGNVTELRNEGNDVIVFEASYNQSVPGLRAHNWTEAVQIIKERASARGL